MKLFRDDGHLTDEALTALAGESLDDLSRLEIAEHLAFCDLCLQRYTLALEPQPLLTPDHSCRESLMRRIRERTLHLITSRYATAAAAVVLALTVVWGSGALIPPEIRAHDEVPAAQTASDPSWAERWSNALDQVVSGWNTWLSGGSPASRISPNKEDNIHETQTRTAAVYCILYSRMRRDVSGIYEAGNFHPHGILWPSDRSNFSGNRCFGSTAAADLDVFLF